MLILPWNAPYKDDYDNESILSMHPDIETFSLRVSLTAQSCPIKKL